MKRALGISAAVAAVLAAGLVYYPNWIAREGYSRFKTGDLTGAISAWSQLEKAPGWAAEAQYNIGVSRCRMGNYSTAAGHFRKSCLTGDSRLRGMALYDLGTALIHVASNGATAPAPAEESRLRDAAASLEESLALAPSNEAAAANLKIAQARLLALSRQPKQQHNETPPNYQRKDQAKDKKPKERDDSRPGNAGKATDLDQEGGKKRRAEVDRNQALRMLNEARGRETIKSATASVLRMNRPHPPEKDW